MAYEPRFLCNMDRIYWGWGCSSICCIEVIVSRCALSHYFFHWEPPDVGLAPTGVWRVPPTPHCNWRILPSSQLFLQGSGRGRPKLVEGRGPRAQGGGGGGLQAALRARPTSGGTRFQDLEGCRRRIALHSLKGPVAP